MQRSDALQYHQDMHSRARSYVNGSDLDPTACAIRLNLKPLVANSYASDNRQLAVHYGLPKGQIAATVKGGRNPDYATWSIFNYPFF